MEKSIIVTKDGRYSLYDYKDEAEMEQRFSQIGFPLDRVLGGCDNEFMAKD